MTCLPEAWCPAEWESPRSSAWWACSLTFTLCSFRLFILLCLCWNLDAYLWQTSVCYLWPPLIWQQAMPSLPGSRTQAVFHLSMAIMCPIRRDVFISMRAVWVDGSDAVFSWRYAADWKVSNLILFTQMSISIRTCHNVGCTFLLDRKPSFEFYHQNMLHEKIVEQVSWSLCKKHQFVSEFSSPLAQKCHIALLSALFASLGRWKRTNTQTQ